jgi:hypothetical protein
MTTDNYVRGVGRLAVSRYEFADHIDGSKLQHNAQTVTLDPPITVTGTPYTNIQDALNAAQTYFTAVVLPDATASVKGVVQLAGDLVGFGSTAASVKVGGLQGVAISVLAPTTSDVLMYNGTSWIASAIPVQFSAGGDLTGSSTSQTVSIISGTGLSGYVLTNCDIHFSKGVNSPTITQIAPVSGAGQVMTIQSQSSTSSGIAGALQLNTGKSAGTNLSAPISLSINQTNTLLELAEPTAGNLVVSLAKGSTITSTEMPINTGNKVIYISDAGTVPSANPVDGSILYSSAGALYVRQSDGDSFKINNDYKIVASKRGYKNLGWNGSTWTAFDSTGSGNYEESTLKTAYYNSAAGDEIKVTCHVLVSGDGWLNLNITETTSPINMISGTEIYVTASPSAPMLITLVGLYTSSVAEQTYASLYFKSDSATFALCGGACIVMEAVRP